MAAPCGDIINMSKNRSGGTSRTRQADTLFAYSLIGPSMLIMVGLIIGPLIYAFWLSLHQVNFMFPGQKFIGFTHYFKMVRDTGFLMALVRTLYFTVVSIGLQVVLGLGVAEFLNRDFLGRRLALVLVIVPWAVPTIVNGTLWLWILDGSTGALNHLLMQLGLIEDKIVWFGRPLLAIHMVILADTWRMLPLYTIMFLAGRLSIPDELYDAAHIDGAGAWKSFLTVTLPLLKSVLLVVLILRTLHTLRVFDIIFVMTKGGPAGGTTTITFLTYFTTFKFQNFGYGAAMAFFTALATLVLALFYIRVLGQREDEA